MKGATIHVMEWRISPNLSMLQQEDVSAMTNQGSIGVRHMGAYRVRLDVQGPEPANNARISEYELLSLRHIHRCLVDMICIFAFKGLYQLQLGARPYQLKESLVEGDETSCFDSLRAFHKPGVCGLGVDPRRFCMEGVSLRAPE